MNDQAAQPIINADGTGNTATLEHIGAAVAAGTATVPLVVTPEKPAAAPAPAPAPAPAAPPAVNVTVNTPTSPKAD